MKINNISFTAVLSPKLLNKIKENQFMGDESRTEKFNVLFHDTFEKNTDANTEIDINEDNNLVFRNNVFPDVELETETMLDEDYPGIVLVNTCPKSISYNEYLLFQKIIRNEDEKGLSFDELQKKVKNMFQDGDRKDIFLNLINIAKKIKHGDKEAVLDEIAFEYMLHLEMMEEMKNPESKIIKQISSMGFEI